MDKKLEAVVKRFLLYSFDPIRFKYAELTKAEKTLCTEEEFEALKAWAQSRSK